MMYVPYRSLQIAFLASPLFLSALASGVCMKFDYLKVLKRPLDFGLSYRGRRVFGDHKTWRGLLINTVLCILGAWIQARIQMVGKLPPWLPLCDYGKLWLPVGLAVGLGATLGELPNSFLKRQLGIAPGKRKKEILGGLFFVLDQMDLAVGVWIFLYFLIKPSIGLILWSLALTVPLHLFVSVIGYSLGMRKTLT
jgi:CDP-2,3-bis-(O-geranylgeranyl)-sn-glycerol synthase